MRFRPAKRVSEESLLRSFREKASKNCASASLLSDIRAKENSLNRDFANNNCGSQPQTPCEADYDKAIEAGSVEAYKEFMDQYGDCELYPEIKSLYDLLQPIDSTITRIDDLNFSARLNYAQWPLRITQIKGPGGQNILLWDHPSDRIFINDSTLVADTTYVWEGGKIEVKGDSFLQFSLHEPNDYKVSITDNRGFSVDLSLRGSIKPISIADVVEGEDKIVFRVSGGEPPYVLKVKKDGETLRNFTLGKEAFNVEDSTYFIEITDYGQYFNESGNYDFFITDSRNVEVEPLAEGVELKGKFPFGPTIYFSLFLLISIFLFIRNWKYQGKK
jgi:hypothetical protein